MDPANREPHDYRVLLEACPDLTIVGGQAVNVWAIVYLTPEELRADSGYGSHDLDVFAQRKVADVLTNLPGWKSEKPPLWSFDRRLLRLTAKDKAGQILIVEVLGKVNGLDDEDLKAVREITANGVVYRALDPVAMLKAKAANVRSINQEGRHDRAHLRLIARCVSPYVRDGHNHALDAAEAQTDFLGVVSRLFRTLADKRILKVILAENIPLHALIPEELASSPLEKVRTAYAHQFPRIRDLAARLSQGT